MMQHLDDLRSISLLRKHDLLLFKLLVILLDAHDLFNSIRLDIKIVWKS